MRKFTNKNLISTKFDLISNFIQKTLNSEPDTILKK